MAGIYLKGAGGLVAMREAPYESEAILQELIARHPEILARDSTEVGAGPWLLVRREAAVYDEEEAASRGSLDHLFIDEEGVPTLVEVKRSSDTRIRREVVAQMLDYAERGTLDGRQAHWLAADAL